MRLQQLRHGARVVLLSTDKAVAPASAMGATKRIAEQIVLSGCGTAVRLCNVLASRDSVAEVFARQIAEGGPITVTDPAVRRYFVTMDEAVDLLLLAASDPRHPALVAPHLRCAALHRGPRAIHGANPGPRSRHPDPLHSPACRRQRIRAVLVVD